MARSRLANPERPGKPESRLEHAAKRIVLRQPVAAAAAAGLLVADAIYSFSTSRRRAYAPGKAGPAQGLFRHRNLHPR
ncbi:MAG: hypothetical protein WCD20_01420 [Rhodomicrobium sp.]